MASTSSSRASAAIAARSASPIPKSAGLTARPIWARRLVTASIAPAAFQSLSLPVSPTPSADAIVASRSRLTGC
ncbi:MAG TPA: hypothetical protein VMU94_10860 [Streptosporangiaceae bacterium]|nr:hypothetical protein [Streptosporangiaceae bacterium]